MIGRNDKCWCGSGDKWKKCHFPEVKPGGALDELKKRYRKQFGILLKSDKEIEGIRRSGRLAAKILNATCARAKAGVTTQELNDYAHKLHLEAGAIPAPLGYGEPPFPRSICTSLNDVICHGIPNDKPLKEGDIMNIDVTCILDGYYGDCSRMVCIGEVSQEKRHVVNVAYECLMRAVQAVGPGVPLNTVGEVIEEYATANHCSVVTQFIGHGVGVEFHENPQVLHYANKINIPLAPGMTFTIEPMINAGLPDARVDPRDGWTATTIDGKPSAQWEHTLLITESGTEILTPWHEE